MEKSSNRVDNDIFNPKMSELYQDMTKPLSDYFIASSFNTYQMGDLISGTISSKRYVEDYWEVVDV